MLKFVCKNSIFFVKYQKKNNKIELIDIFFHEKCLFFQNFCYL